MKTRFALLAALPLLAALAVSAPTDAEAHRRHRHVYRHHHHHHHHGPRVILHIPFSRPAPPEPLRVAPEPAGPAVGDVVKVLPQGAAVRMVGGVYYRVHDDIWYRWSAPHRGWVVDEAP